MKSRGDGHDKSEELLGKKDNVIHLKVPRKKRDAVQPSTRPKNKQSVSVTSKWAKNEDETVQISHTQSAPPKNAETLINIPHYTKYLLGLILAIHLVVVFILNEMQANWLYINLGFIPGRFTGVAIFEPLALITPLTHMFIHGSWLHIAMNSIMLLAFGAGVEKWIGGQKMILFFILSGLFGLLAHFALNPQSYNPMIGASGGLSGLFAIALVMLNRQKNLPMGKYGFWPLILLWVGISVLFGSMGSPDGSQIAWATHVGGFLGGFILAKWIKL